MDATILDLETVPLANAMDYFDERELDDVAAPSNYKDPIKIEAYIAAEKDRRRQSHLDRASLDPDLCRIAALGVWLPQQAHPCLWLCADDDADDDAEAEALAAFWTGYRTGEVLGGYNIRAFDLPVLYRRSLYLGVPAKVIDRDRYRSTCVLDLFELLTENRKDRMRSLTFYCKRFGIVCNIDDPIDGKDVPACVARGDWESVRSHLLADLVRTRGLARRVCGD